MKKHIRFTIDLGNWDAPNIKILNNIAYVILILSVFIETDQTGMTDWIPNSVKHIILAGATIFKLLEKMTSLKPTPIDLGNGDEENNNIEQNNSNNQ